MFVYKKNFYYIQILEKQVLNPVIKPKSCILMLKFGSMANILKLNIIKSLRQISFIILQSYTQ